MNFIFPYIGKNNPQLTNSYFNDGLPDDLVSGYMATFYNFSVCTPPKQELACTQLAYRAAVLKSLTLQHASTGCTCY